MGRDRRSQRAVGGPLIAPVAAGTFAAAGAFGWAVRGRSSNVFGRSVWRGPGNRRALALTFDDGPSHGTSELLSVLQRENVRATFFMCGMHARRLPSVSREVVAAGHEVGNHSETHAPLYLRMPGFVRDQIGAAQQSITDNSGAAPALFRPPYGVRWFGMRSALREFGLTNVMWTILGRDWTLPGEAVARRITHSVTNGSILCLHDGRERSLSPDITSTLQAVRSALPILRDQGWQFCTVSELIGYIGAQCPKTSSGA